MKTTGTKLLLLMIFLFGLSACLMDTTIPVQITILNVDCNTDEVQISDEIIELSGEHSWTAKCKGKTYTCSYLSESGADCYEIDE